MKKKTTIILALVLSICMMVAMSLEAFAGVDNSQKTYSGTLKSIDSEYIGIWSPSEGDVFYAGETVPYDITCWDTWTYYYTRPFIDIADTDNNIRSFKSLAFVPADSSRDYTGKMPTQGLSAGSYDFNVIHFAYESTYDDVGDYVELGNEPFASVTIKVKKLKAPTNVKAIAGKKKVTVKFNKATGATKYQIFRSTKKSSGYKRIATTTKVKYVDKKVKKGKRYYYKVKSVRAVGHGTVKSGFSAKKRSGKVKR